MKTRLNFVMEDMDCRTPAAAACIRRREGGRVEEKEGKREGSGVRGGRGRREERGRRSTHALSNA